MNTVSSLSTASFYRNFLTSNQQSSGRSSGSIGNSGQGSQDTSSEQDTSLQASSDDDTDTETPTIPSPTTVTNSQAAADYRSLAKDIQAGNVTAVQTDDQKLQTDLAITRPHHGGHHKSASQVSPTLAVASGSAGRTLNVTV